MFLLYDLKAGERNDPDVTSCCGEVLAGSFYHLCLLPAHVQRGLAADSAQRLECLLLYCMVVCHLQENRRDFPTWICPSCMTCLQCNRPGILISHEGS